MEKKTAKDAVAVAESPKDVFNIVEGKDGKERWVKIGHAFLNRDGSINAYLDVFPRDGKLQIRDRRIEAKAAS